MDARIDSRVREARHSRGWTQSRLAELAGISRQSLAAIEAAASIPATDVALRLAAALESPVDELFGLPPSPEGAVEADLALGAAARAGTRVRLARIAGRLLAFPLAGDVELCGADGRIEAATGRRARIRMLRSEPARCDLVVAGCDPAFGLVAETLRTEGVAVLALQRGSRAALEALARGEVHVAGVHLRDPATGEYNAPWIRRLVPFACTRVRFSWWEVCLLLAAGNPQGIAAVADLVRPGVRFVNREPGSGTRALLDRRLAEAGVPGSAIAGYEATSAGGHLAVAAAVGAGLAAAGVGIRAAALVHGLDAVSLEAEPYELVVPAHFMEAPAVATLLRVLTRPTLRRQVEALGGYDVAEMGTTL